MLTLENIDAGYGPTTILKDVSLNVAEGEIVVLIGPPLEGAKALAQADLDTRIAQALMQHSVKDAAAIVSAETGIPKREVYARALHLGTAQRADGEADNP